GGKRLRPALVHFAYQAVGGLGNDRTLPVEMAVELLHTYLLIHDDIMDRAETRRGGSAAHRLFAKEHRRRGWRDGSARHGEAAAILLGDLAHSHAVGLFLSGVADAVNGAQISRCFTEMCREVVIGQYLEMTAPLRGGLKEQDLLSILRLKSGRYSVERPIQLGALLGGASSHVVESLAGYGLAMGEAFQLQDDLLGVFGEREFVGKPVGGDLAEGKFTLLILAAMERADSAQRETILRCLQTEDPDAEEVSGVRTLVERVGAREKIESMVHERLERSAEALKKLDLNAEAKAFFFGLIDYLRERKA
ncbi:MAG: polyprenyl synthetase family protein, partial [Acidobacteriota bacterium]|nr:polyprenyl synthetase family protein [Acidobacteriota bacterium]